MKKLELNKKHAYVKPACEQFFVKIDNLLQSASGNAGTIGHGGTFGDAKRWNGPEEEDSETFGNWEFNSWED